MGIEKETIMNDLPQESSGEFIKYVLVNCCRLDEEIKEMSHQLLEEDIKNPLIQKIARLNLEQARMHRDCMNKLLYPSLNSLSDDMKVVKFWMIGLTVLVTGLEIIRIFD